MKNLLSLFVCCFLIKFAAATTVDINKSFSQSLYIRQGGSYAYLGDQPATVDSLHNRGIPFKEGFRIYCEEDSVNYIARSGVWVPIVFVRPSDTAAMLSPYAKTSNVNSVLALKQDLLISGTNIKTVGGSSLLGSGNVLLPSGTVTSVGLTSSDFSISGSPITSSGNITANLTTTGITAGTYGRITVDSKGRSMAGKRQEPYTATTNGSGVATITYSSAFSALPNVMINFSTSNPRDVAMLTSSSTTGCTILVQRRVDVLGLLPTYSNQSGVSVDILVTEY